MIVKKNVYFCKHCKNIVESLWDGKPDISCCGEPMQALTANTTEAATEKHIPVVKREGNKVLVNIGEKEHPMEEKHYILFVEIMTSHKVLRYDYPQGASKTEVEFLLDENESIQEVRSFCNLHGLWAAKL